MLVQCALLNNSIGLTWLPFADYKQKEKKRKKNKSYRISGLYQIISSFSVSKRLETIYSLRKAYILITTYSKSDKSRHGDRIQGKEHDLTDLSYLISLKDFSTHTHHRLFQIAKNIADKARKDSYLSLDNKTISSH